MKKILETGMLVFAAMGFWGMIYPDLCFTQDVCEVSIEEEDAEENDMLLADIFTSLCMAEPEQIKVKSRFVEVFITGKQGKVECHQ